MRGIETLLITSLIASMVMATLSLGLPAPAPAQVVKAGVVTTLQGTATVARGTVDQAPLRFRDDVYVQDRITTGDESLARILLGGKAVVTVRERSQLKITETATTSTIEVSDGKIALAVDKSRMKPGESVEIRTPNATAAIRGTIIIAEVSPPAGPGHDVATRFTLLTGIVDVTLLDPSTGRSRGRALTLKPLQTVGITGFTPPGAPHSITRADAQAIAVGFAVPLKEPPAGANAQVVDEQVRQATQQVTKGNDGRPVVADRGADGASDTPGDSRNAGRRDAVGKAGRDIGGGIGAGGDGDGAVKGGGNGDDVRRRDRDHRDRGRNR
jgi:FecR protein